MNGWLTTLKKLFNHERYQSIAACLIVVFLFWLYGCESKTESIRDPMQKVTRGELQAEVDYYLSMAKSRFSELDRQDAVKRILTEQAMLATQSGTINPMGVAAALIGAFGIGATIDNVRKRKEIKDIKKNNSS